MNRMPWLENPEPIDPGFERMQKDMTEQQGDTFDAFCARQRNRIGNILSRTVTRMNNEYCDTAMFESRK